MSKLNILISGGGIAGPCLAWWLHKGLPNSNITILERAPEPRVSGQAIDIRDFGVDVVRRMGLIDLVKSRGTTEEGISFVYSDGVTKATFPASGDEENQGFTSEFEILRGDLAEIFYDVTKETVRWQFDEYIEGVEELGSGKVKVTFANHLQPEEYDVVVGADGIVSRTRRVVWGKGPDEKEYIKSMGQYCSFFTIPKTDEDSKFAHVFNVPGGRISALRPDRYGETRAYLGVTYSDMAKFYDAKTAMGESVETQKKWLQEQFADALGEWQLARIVGEMKDSKDFYMQQTAQVKIDEGFVKGRVTLVGDAGYCPSPISGMVSYSLRLHAVLTHSRFLGNQHSNSRRLRPGRRTRAVAR
jgi:2-polyprenyl-6-methoxyphenol hydroxylase-like FAD-dependent oxidoreductase